MNIMKKRNIFLGLVLMLGLTGCYDLDKMPEGVLSTTIPFASTGEMRNYLDQFCRPGNIQAVMLLPIIRQNFFQGNISDFCTLSYPHMLHKLIPKLICEHRIN